MYLHPLLPRFFSYEHSRRRPNCPHISNQEYIKPASFEFILANKSDSSAICDINNRTTDKHPDIPQTPIRRGTSSTTTQSTVKSKKIRISVPQSAVKPSETPQSSRSSRVITVIPSTSKKNPNSTPTNPTNLKNILINLFPTLKPEQDKILNWTMEELFDNLIREKAEMFQEFLGKRQKIGNGHGQNEAH